VGLSGTALAAGCGGANISLEHRDGAKIKSKIVCGWLRSRIEGWKIQDPDGLSGTALAAGCGGKIIQDQQNLEPNNNSKSRGCELCAQCFIQYRRLRLAVNQVIATSYGLL